MEEKQVKKPSAGYAVFVGILGLCLIASLFGDFKMIFSADPLVRGSFIDLVKAYTGLMPAIAAGGNDVKLYIYEHVGEMCLGLAAVGCLITYFVHIIRYFIAVGNYKEESDTRRMTSNLAGFTYTGLIYSAISVLIVLGLIKNGDKIVYAVIPGWGGLLAIVASIVGLIVLTVKAGKDERKVGVLKTSGALTVLFVSLCALLTYATLFDYQVGFVITPFEALRQVLYSLFSGGGASPLAIAFIGGGLVLMFTSFIFYKGIVRNVLETKAYFKEEKQKKYNPHVRILVYGILATVFYLAGCVALFLGRLPESVPSIVFYVAAGLHVITIIFVIVYFANYGKNRPLPVLPPKKESEEDEESSEEEEGKEEEKPAEEAKPEEVAEEQPEEAKPEVEAEPEEEPQKGYFDFFKPVSKSTTSMEELGEKDGGVAPAPVPVYHEVKEEEPVAEEAEEAPAEEPVEEAPVEEAPVEEPVAEEPVVEEAAIEEAPVEEEVVEEQPEEPAEEETPEEEKKSAPVKKAAAPKKSSEKKDDPGYRTYHLVKRDDGKWEVKFAGGQKAIKLFNTQKEAVEYAKVLSENQGGTYLIHNSKGANKGRIQKK